jgi:inorganic triphosphatase YgiF
MSGAQTHMEVEIKLRLPGQIEYNAACQVFEQQRSQNHATASQCLGLWNVFFDATDHRL